MASRSIMLALLRRSRSSTYLENSLGRRLQVLTTKVNGSALISDNNDNCPRWSGGTVSFCLPSRYGVRDIHMGRVVCSKTYITCASCSHSYSKNVEDFVNLVCCPKCDTLQKLQRSELPNYFQILRQPKSYRVNLTKIANQMKQLQKVFHPDLYGGKGQGQQNLSQEYSSLLNKALTTLTDPIERGRYLLLLGGVDIEDPSSNLEGATTTDPQFLRVVMELNEELEGIGTEQSWRHFRDRNVTQLQTIQERLAEAFEMDDLDVAQQVLGRMKYYDSLQNRIRELQSRIGIVE